MDNRWQTRSDGIYRENKLGPKEKNKMKLWKIKPSESYHVYSNYFYSNYVYSNYFYSNDVYSNHVYSNYA